MLTQDPDQVIAPSAMTEELTELWARARLLRPFLGRQNRKDRWRNLSVHYGSGEHRLTTLRRPS